MTNTETTNPYDDFPYPHLTHSHTHPERMETLAAMLGMSPAPVDNCRVLELGCASGFNLFPFAYCYPNSDFIGVDYSEVQIDYGIERVKELGLTNVELLCQDVMDIQVDLGLFDYIIIHGIYSWVPPAVRDQLIVLSKRHLAPKGVAYISYNTYPGWAMMGMLRGMMLYRVRDIETPMEKANEARKLVEFLHDSIGPKESAYGAYLGQYLELIRKKRVGTKVEDVTLLLHDELEEFNEPVYFHEFVEHANSHGLQYLVEAEFSSVIPSRHPTEVGDYIRQISRDTIEMEQYLDFLNFRTFRRTLLCHDAIEVNRIFTPEVVFDFHLVSEAKPVTDRSDDLPENLVQFRGKDGANFTTDHSLTIEAFNYLGKIFPRAVSFKEVIKDCLKEVFLNPEESVADHAAMVAGNFLRAYSYSESLVEFHIRPYNVTQNVSDKPEASMIARWQLDYMVKVTNMRHERVTLDSLSRYLLRLLNGKRDKDELLELLSRDIEAGSLKLEIKETNKSGSEDISKLVKIEIDNRLEFFARASLLIA